LFFHARTKQQFKARGVPSGLFVSGDWLPTTSFERAGRSNLMFSGGSPSGQWLAVLLPCTNMQALPPDPTIFY
jgi:hypothetical protein